MSADAAGVAALLEQLAVDDPTTIEALPEELLPLILHFHFSKVGDLLAAAGVCRAWRRQAEVVAKEQLGLAGWSPSLRITSWLRAYHVTAIVHYKFRHDRRHEFWRGTGVSSEWRLLRIEQVMRMAQGDPARLEVLRAHIQQHMTSAVFGIGHLSWSEEMRRLEPQLQWMEQHGWEAEAALVVSMASYGGSYAVAAAFRNEAAMGAFALSVIPRQVMLPSLLCATCMFLWRAFSVYAYSAEEQDETDNPQPRIYPAPDAFASLKGEFGLADEDPAWLELELLELHSRVFTSHCISVCMAANDLNFPDGEGFRTPVRVDGVVEYRVRDSPVVRFISAPRDRSGCHSLIPVDDDTFRVPPLARITLERIDEPGEWSANGHVIRQRCYTVSLSYG